MALRVKEEFTQKPREKIRMNETKLCHIYAQNIQQQQLNVPGSLPVKKL